MTDRELCKGCTESVIVSDRQIERILASLSAHPDDCVQDEVYNRRMVICSACPSFAYGTTCLHCGCFVAVRAKFKDKGCPIPGQPKW